MTPTRITACLATTALAVVTLVPTAFARDGRDDDAVHAAAAAKADPRMRANQASLDTILADARRRHPGEVLDISYDDGAFDIDIRQRDGRVVELEYSARTGRLLETDVD